MTGQEIIQVALARLVGGQNLNRVQTYEVMEIIMNGEATHAQIGGLLAAFRYKG